MNVAELEALVDGPRESQHVEFKRQIETQRDLARSIVCFANADGGSILIGVDEVRGIVGVDDADRVSLDVDDAAYQGCEPPVSVVIETVDGTDPPVVLVRVPRGDARPYRTKQGQFYVRSGTRCRQASQEELRTLFQSAGALSFDETDLVSTTVDDDLDEDAFRRYLGAYAQAALTAGTDTASVARRLIGWRLASDAGRLTVAGMLLFGRDPQRLLPQAQVSLARVAGTEPGGEPLDQLTATGTLFEQIEQAERFLTAHLRVPRQVEGFGDERRPEVPAGALREILINAVVHRDYVPQAPIRVLVYDDRVEIRSPGRPPNTLDVEAMFSGVHVMRNPHLYTRLYQAGLVTDLGSGLPRARALVREVEGMELTLDVTATETIVAIPRPDSTKVESS